MLNLYYDKELKEGLAINAKIGKNVSVCLFPSAVNVIVCTSIIRVRLYMELTAYDCLLDIGFAVLLMSISHSFRHWLRIILTSAAHILDIGFALTARVRETQTTLTLHNSQCALTSASHYLDIGFAFGLTSASPFLGPIVQI